MGLLLVANRSGGSISFIDLTTGIEIARVPIGPEIPHEVHVSADGRFALTTEYGPEDNHGRHIVLMDVASASVVSRINLGPNSRPHTALFLPDGRHAVATMQSSDQLALVDLEAKEVVRMYPTGGREGHMVRLSPDGSRAYVTSRGAEGTLSVIFLNEERSPVVIATGLGAEGLDVTAEPRGGNFGVLIHDGMAFASDPNAGTIQVFELDGLTDRQLLAVEHEAPDGLAWSPVRVRVMAE